MNNDYSDTGFYSNVFSDDRGDGGSGGGGGGCDYDNELT